MECLAEQSKNGFYRLFVRKVIDRVGRDKYVFAVGKKEDTKDSHIINTLNSLGILAYRESFELLKESLRELGNGGVIIDYDPNDITVFEGDVYLCSDDGSRIKVKPIFYPHQDTDEIQILLSYDHCQNLSLESSIQKTEERGDIICFTFKDIVRKALLFNASDIHILPKTDHYRVFFRIDGRFLEIPEFLMNVEQGKAFSRMIRIEASDHTKGSFNIDETKVSQLGKIEYSDLGVGLRLEFVPDGRTLEHVDITARIISKGSLEISANMEGNLRKCGFAEDDIVSFESITRRKTGLVVVSGVVNSGKSTTIWNVLPALDRTKKIGTVEDPVECVLDRHNIIQHQIYEPEKESLKMGFEQFIKSFKRGDYDVVFIGEWRKSKGLTEAIVEQANAGQLIFTTLHVKSSFEIYSAISEMFHIQKNVSARLVLMSLNQLLLPKLCKHCKIETDIGFSQDDVRYLNTLTKIEKEKLLSFSSKGYRRKEEGCSYCYHTGYKGRTVIYDYFIPTQEFISEVVKNDLSPNEIKNLALMYGIGKTKLSVFLDRVREGLIEKSCVEEI
ncbi:MAG: Flp pilus assembly complex ATPase component TadA [Nitrospirae bacterium]|nr:Flp pilus assembly complex ATPase component TadA [Nitrospirota bacterium]